MTITRALRDYWKHEAKADNPTPSANVFSMVVGWLHTAGFSLEQAERVIDEIQTEMDIIRGKQPAPGWRVNVRLFSLRPGKVAWNGYVRSLFPVKDRFDMPVTLG